MKIPMKMDNEQSKLVAAIINAERAVALESARLYGLRNRYEKEYGDGRIQHSGTEVRS